jgi:hypothetical protein
VIREKKILVVLALGGLTGCVHEETRSLNTLHRLAHATHSECASSSRSPGKEAKLLVSARCQDLFPQLEAAINDD